MAAAKGESVGDATQGFSHWYFVKEPPRQKNSFRNLCDSQEKKRTQTSTQKQTNKQKKNRTKKTKTKTSIEL